MSDLVRDIRLAARMLWRSPGFTAVALATIALGIGGNTAMFSVVNAVLLRPLPYARPERLVAVYQTLTSRGIASNGISWQNYEDFAARTRSFDALGALRMHDFTLTGQGEPALVSPDSHLERLRDARIGLLRGRASSLPTTRTPRRSPS
jgi:hypothetical protein